MSIIVRYDASVRDTVLSVLPDLIHGHKPLHSLITDYIEKDADWFDRLDKHLISTGAVFQRTDRDIKLTIPGEAKDVLPPLFAGFGDFEGRATVHVLSTKTWIDGPQMAGFCRFRTLQRHPCRFGPKEVELQTEDGFILPQKIKLLIISDGSMVQICLHSGIRQKIRRPPVCPVSLRLRTPIPHQFCPDQQAFLLRKNDVRCRVETTGLIWFDIL
jgi:hypothetical protein